MEPGKDKYRLIMEQHPDAFAFHQIITDSSGKPADYIFLDVNLAFEEMTGLSREQVIGKKASELHQEMGNYSIDWINSFGKVALTGESVCFEQYFDISDRWYTITAYSDDPGYFTVFFRDITEVKQAKAEQRRMEWMLDTGKIESLKETLTQSEPSYGSLTELNTSRFILDSIGEDMLADIAKDYLGLLETSTAIYEKNGDYALGIFSSGWCRFLDQASRRLCQTDDNRIALQSGKWLCHESCWTNASKAAIETGEPVDIACHGGLHLYAVPIWVKDEVVGAINFGYGDPPQEPAELQKIAYKYAVDPDELRQFAEAYEPRPPFIIHLAKERLHSSAKLIGTMLEQKQADKVLRKSEEKFRTYIENAPLGVLVVNREGKFIEVNQEACRIRGYTKNELLQHTISDIIHPEKAFTARKHFEQVQEKGRARETLKGIKKDGSTFWYDNLAVKFNEDLYISFQTDVTERVEADRKIKESEEKFRTIFDQNILALYLHDFAGNIIDVNNQACLQLGYSYKELLKMSVFDFIYTEESGGYLAKEEILHIWDQMDVGERTTVEDVHQRKDGTIFYVEVSTGVIRYNDGNIIMALVKDITERKQTEKMMQARLNLLTFATNNPLDAVLQKALDEVCDLLNSPIGFFHLVSADEKMLTLQAWSSDTLQSFCEMGDKSGMYYSVNEAGVWADCVHERRPVIHNDYACLPHRKGLPEGHSMVTREIVVPVVRNDRIVAILGIGNKPQDYTDTDIQFASFFADVTWEIVEDKLAEQKLADYTRELEQLYRYLDQEISKAQQVHEQILPQSLPFIENISFAAYYQPAEKMGGDFYDLIHRGNKLIIYLSDVSGHGMDGAMLSFFVKNTISSYIDLAPAETIKPKAVLNYLAEKFHRETFPEELYIAIFLAVLDLETLELTYSGAGFQEKPLVRLGSGEQLKLVSKGLFISRLFPFNALNLEEDSVKLSPGSTLFFTTDGLTEQDASGAYYMDRLPNVFTENAHLPPELIKQAVVEDFRRFAGGSLQGNDDITFLVLRVKESST